MCYLRPLQRDPLGRTGLVVAGLSLDGPMSQAEGVLQRLLLGRADLPRTQHGPRPRPAVARLPALGPVAYEPPGREKNQSWAVTSRTSVEHRLEQRVSACLVSGPTITLNDEP